MSAKKKILINLQWVVVIAISYFLLFREGEVIEDLRVYSLVLLFLISVLVLYRLPPAALDHRSFAYILVIVDTVLISLGILLHREWPWDLFLIFFFGLFIAGIGENLLQIVIGCLIVSIISVILSSLPSTGTSALDSDLLLRIPFIFGVSLLYGYLAQQVKQETRRLTETQHNLEHLSALHSVTAIASESLHLDSILQEVIKKITEIFHFDATRIFLFDPQENELHLRASLETTPKFFAGARAFRRGQGLVGRVADTGEALIFEDALSDPRYQELSHSKLSQKGKFSFFAALPIKVKKRLIGVLVCIGKDSRRPKPNEIRLITSMVDQIAVAVENAQLFEQTKSQTLQLEKDITERKRVEEQLNQTNAELARRETALRDTLSELKAAQLQLFQAEKLESVGRLAAGVAHEVKNPLAIILQAVNYLSRHLPTNGNNVAMVLQEVDNAVKRANFIVRGLLDFSAANELNLNTEQLNSMLEQSLLLVKHELDKYHVNVVRELSECLSPVKLDRNKIEQVFVNIFMNAIHAMPEGGTLAIKTYANQLTKVDHNVGSRKADHLRIGETVVMVEVEDTGTGIPNDQLAEIFDPFFTTKSTGKGTGLGLTVTKKIIDLHGGTINIRNRKEGGVRATVMFKSRGGNEL
jgi:signal transduction histidine kinase